MGRSLSTEPSIQRCGEGFQGTASPVFGSLARIVAAEKTRGTEHEAALRIDQYEGILANKTVSIDTHTADQIKTLGAVM